VKTAELFSIPLALCAERDCAVFEGQRFTFEQVNARANQAATALAGLGVQPGDRVAILQVNCHQYIESFFGSAKLGTVFVPLNYRAKADELVHMINSCEASTLLVGPRYLDLVDSLRPQLKSVRHYLSLETPHGGMHHYDALVGGASSDEVFPAGEDDEATVLLYTAGTTAFPKGVIHTHNTLTLYILENVNPPDPEINEVNLLVVPLYHIAGLQGMLASVYGGRTIVLQRQFDAGAWLRAVHEERVTHSVVVPTMLKQVIDHADFARSDLSSLRQITYGAASMPLEVISRAVDLLPNVRFINAFGQTETAGTVTALGPEDHIISGTPEEREKKLQRLSLSIGRALPGVEVCVFDQEGCELPPGQEGEIVARGPRVMAGYWGQPEATAATIRDGWVYTGDIGWMDDEGYFYLSGRAKDMIIRGGENISPEEVENVVHSHPCVEEAAVIGLPDVEWGESVCAVVTLKPSQTATAEEIIEYCRQRLASFKKPEKIIFTDALPRNAMGKVLKTTLRELYAQPAKSGAS